MKLPLEYACRVCHVPAWTPCVVLAPAEPEHEPDDRLRELNAGDQRPIPHFYRVA